MCLHEQTVLEDNGQVSEELLRQVANALDDARDAATGSFATLDRTLRRSVRQLTGVLHEVGQAPVAVARAATIVTAKDGLVQALRATRQEVELTIARERRETSAQLHEHKIMWSRHAAIYYPRAHPAIRRPTREPMLPAGMRYVDVSHLPLRPDSLDIDSGRERDRNVCHLVAPLAAYAHRQPDLLLNCVRLDRGKVVVTVPGGQYRLDPTLPADQATGALAGIGMTGGYTLLAFIEKAFAAEHGGYEKLEFRSPSDAMSWLGGTTVWAERTRDFPPDELAQLLSHPERVLTTGTIKLSHPEYATDAALAQRYKAPVADHAGHAVTLRHVDVYGRVHTRNTWGEQDPEPVPLEHFSAVFPVVFWEAIYGDPPPPSMRTVRI